MHDLTGFQRDLLWTVAELAPANGQAISRDLAETYDEQINHGRLYPNLDSLVEKGLIEKSVRQPDNRSNTYSMTEHGINVLVERLDWEADRVDSVFDSTPVQATG